MKIKISKLVRDLSYKEIKERKWVICKVTKKEKYLVFLDYIVSDRGEIMRLTSAMGTCPGKIFKPRIQDGYSRVTLRKKGQHYHLLFIN